MDGEGGGRDEPATVAERSYGSVAIEEGESHGAILLGEFQYLELRYGVREIRSFYCRVNIQRRNCDCQ
jgi:hypothetical protein